MNHEPSDNDFLNAHIDAQKERIAELEAQVKGWLVANAPGGWIDNLRIQVKALREELSNIVNAKRFDRECFDDDSSFADWAQSRARYTLAGTAPKEPGSGRKEG